MKKLYKTTIFLLTLALTLLGGASNATAAPTNEQKAFNNPQVVSYYPLGNHTVIQPDNTIEYGKIGADLVLEAGEDKTFQQWYRGIDGEKTHTVWRNVNGDTQCPSNWLYIQNPYQPPTGDTWGYHFPDGDNYCAKSN